MARVRPFAAWRYASTSTDLTPVVAPPYDVISEAQRAAFAEADPHNVVELELATGPLDPEDPHGRYRKAAQTWDSWKSDGVLLQDPVPCLYVLEQRFGVGDAQVRRRAFIVEVGLEPFEAGVVLPHERTLPTALGDRFELIKATGANFSQVFGLYDDQDCDTDAIFDEVSAGTPVAEAVDADGVSSVLWRSTDAELAGRLTDFMAAKQIFIADGHHRYTTALAHRDLLAEQGAAPDGPHEYVMMALVNMDDPDLAVLPYHRIADARDPFDAQEFKARLEEWFAVEELPPGHPGGALDGRNRVSFLFKTSSDERPLLATLRDAVDPAQVIDVDRTDEWKHLDVAILQELILWPLLGIHPDRPETLDRLSFTKDAHEALKATGTHDVAFILRPTRLDQLRAVSLSGETMPQKSTYFYPKLLSGLVFRDAR